MADYSNVFDAQRSQESPNVGGSGKKPQSDAEMLLCAIERQTKVLEGLGELLAKIANPAIIVSDLKIDWDQHKPSAGHMLPIDRRRDEIALSPAERAAFDRAVTGATYWLNGSPHEHTHEDAVAMAKFIGMIAARVP